MKSLIMILLVLMSADLMAKTLKANYSLTSKATAKEVSRNTIDVLNSTSQGSIDIISTENNVPTKLSEKILTTDSLHLMVETIGRNSAVINELNNQLSLTTPAVIARKAFGGPLTLLSATFKFGEIKTIDRQVAELVANTLGTDQFKLELTLELHGITCSPDVVLECTSSVLRTYSIEVQ